MNACRYANMKHPGWYYDVPYCNGIVNVATDTVSNEN